MMTTISVTYLKYRAVSSTRCGGASWATTASRWQQTYKLTATQPRAYILAASPPSKNIHMFPKLYNFYTSDVVPTAWKVWSRGRHHNDLALAAKDARTDDFNTQSIHTSISEINTVGCKYKRTTLMINGEGTWLRSEAEIYKRTLTKTKQ